MGLELFVAIRTVLLRAWTAGTLVWAALLCGTLHAQVRARISTNEPPPLTDIPASNYGAAAPGPATGGSLAPLTPSGTVPAGAAIGQPGFDPYGASPTPSVGSSLFGSSANPGYGAPSVYAPPSSLPPSLSTSPTGAGAGLGAGAGPVSPYGATPYGTTPYGAAVPYGAAPGGAAAPYGSPPALFPNGISGPSGLWNQETIVGAPVRLIQGPRIRHAWIASDGDDDALGINDSDISVVLTYPNFFFSNQPLYVAPSFSLHLWDGPVPTAFAPPAEPDLPANAYSAYLDALWRSDPLQIFGVDIGTRVGVFTDFDTFNEDSLRVMGQGIFRMRVTPTVTLKGGVIYTDRADIKLVPAGGILWEPNPQARFDIYFPQPKVSQYLTTLGNQDVWWYIAGEFGGGSWTIERAVDGDSDRVDFNDIRVLVGVEWGPGEWFHEGRRLGFVEAGWVTERQLVYVRRPQDNVDLPDTFMLRAGIGY